MFPITILSDICYCINRRLSHIYNILKSISFCHDFFLILIIDDFRNIEVMHQLNNTVMQ